MGDAPLHVAVRQAAGGITVLAPDGVLDFTTAPALEGVFDPRAPHPRYVVDFTDVTFMDSSGINVLIGAHQAHDPGGWLRLAGVRRPVLRTLEIVGLTTLIDCYPDVREAMAA